MNELLEQLLNEQIGFVIKSFVNIKEREAIQLSNQLRKDRPKGTHNTEEIEAAFFAHDSENPIHLDVLYLDNKIVGAIAYELGNKGVFVHHLGSLVKGGGTYLIKIVLQFAKKNDVGIRFESSDAARGFYQKLGFTQNKDIDKMFVASKEQIDSILDKI